MWPLTSCPLPAVSGNLQSVFFAVTSERLVRENITKQALCISNFHTWIVSGSENASACTDSFLYLVPVPGAETFLHSFRALKLRDSGSM